jgi:hypothetical protein
MHKMESFSNGHGFVEVVLNPAGYAHHVPCGATENLLTNSFDKFF